jgi:hypothetical protein
MPTGCSISRAFPGYGEQAQIPVNASPLARARQKNRIDLRYIARGMA